MEGSPFNRSVLTRRSPPPSPAPVPQPRASPPAPPPEHNDDFPVLKTTPEIHNWMATIEKCLNEVCAISCEGKLNTDQKLKINNLCRKVANGTSHMAVEYQSLKQKAISTYRDLQALQENLDLSQQLQEIKQNITESSKPVTNTVSFADIVKTSSNNFIQPRSVSSLAIYPKDKLKSSEETRSLVQKIIQPEKMKLQVRGLRNTINGGVIISTDTKDDIEKLKQSAQLTTSGLTIDEPHKRRPRIVIIGVPTNMQEAEVFNCIFQQNLADKLEGTTLETFLSSIKLSHKSGKKDNETCNYIIEVPAYVRKALITKDRVFVNWSSCPVRDFTLVTRCFKCQQYGHAAKSCRQSVNICGHCGVEGHMIKECTKKADPPKCATCMHFKKPANHKTGDVDCPAKKVAEKWFINSIDYDSS